MMNINRHKLLILTPPSSMRSGSDVLGPATSLELTRHGIDNSIKDLWPDNIYKVLSHCLPYHVRAPLYKNTFARMSVSRLLQKISSNTIVWILETALPYNDLSCRFEQSIIRRGCPYIFHIKDDWFSLDTLTAQRAKVRIPMADLVVTATKQLQHRIIDLFPNAKVVCLEEPIDIHRIAPAKGPKTNRPVLLWVGNPTNLKEIPEVLPALEAANKEIPFTLRIISGARRNRSFSASFPCEYFNFDYQREAELMAGSIAGIAPLKDTPYARCKGTYKIKTYMAAGIPVIASPVGYHNELITHAETGFFACNTNEWTNYILEVLRNKEQAKQMGIRARTAAVARFSHEVVIKTWADELLKYFPQLKRSSLSS